MDNTVKRKPLNTAEKQTHHDLMGLVKADRHLDVERFLLRRKHPERLLNAKPTNCYLLDEAVSARMRGLLRKHGATMERKHESPAGYMPSVVPGTTLPVPGGVPNVFLSWATT